VKGGVLTSLFRKSLVSMFTGRGAIGFDKWSKFCLIKLFSVLGMKFEEYEKQNSEHAKGYNIRSKGCQGLR
jgi:hypothetical protein